MDRHDLHRGCSCLLDKEHLTKCDIWDLYRNEYEGFSLLACGINMYQCLSVLLSALKIESEVPPKWYYLSVELRGIIFQHDLEASCWMCECTLVWRRTCDCLDSCNFNKTICLAVTCTCWQPCHVVLPEPRYATILDVYESVRLH
jgi:hypothetical protein